MKSRVAGLTRARYAIRTLDWIFERPFRTTDFVATAGIPRPTARRFLDVLRKDGFLKVLSVGRGRRAATSAFPNLLDIAKARGVF